MSDSQLSTWKTIKPQIGDKDDLLSLISSGRTITAGAMFLIDQIDLSIEPFAFGEVVLARVTSFGLTERKVSVQDFWRVAYEHGLGLCSHRLALDIAAVYGDQPSGEVLRIAMNPIRDVHTNRSIFELAHAEEGLYLDIGYVNPESWYSCEGLWAFCRITNHGLIH